MDKQRREQFIDKNRAEKETGKETGSGKLQVESLALGSLPTNTYLVWRKGEAECLVIDPSDGADQIISFLEGHGLKPAAIYLTHGHDDHIGSVNELKQRYGILAYIGKDEEEFAESSFYNLSQMFGHPRVIEPDLFFLDGQKVEILGTEMEVIATPGHTPGGVCYYFPEDRVLFSGDTLFEESVGRSDFPGGSTLSLVRSVRRLLTLPDDVLVYPGHGGRTSIGHEKKRNPYVKAAEDRSEGGTERKKDGGKVEDGGRPA